MIGPFSRQFDRLVADAAAGLYVAANGIIRRSEQLVPVDTGTLRGSARVMEPTVSGDRVEVVAGYGYGDEYAEKAGDGVGYAIWVEERVELHHERGQAKFLSTAAQEAIPELGAAVAVEMRKPRVGGGVTVEALTEEG